MHHVAEFGVLGDGVSALLEIEVGPGVQRFDDDLFPALAGKDDERLVDRAFHELCKKLYPVHATHLVIGDDRIVLPFLEHDKRFLCR